MICLLDDFVFESDGVGLNGIKRSMLFGFEQSKLINAHDDWQATNKFSQEITLSGRLVRKSNRALLDLERMAERKLPVTLAFEDGRALSVVILSIETDQSLFLKYGAFLKQDFDVRLGVVYGG